jgi:hypothetical protein
MLDHPATDCLYLALAEQRSAVLLTQEQRLLRKVREVPQAAGLAMAIEELVPSPWPMGRSRCPRSTRCCRCAAN